MSYIDVYIVYVHKAINVKKNPKNKFYKILTCSFGMKQRGIPAGAPAHQKQPRPRQRSTVAPGSGWQSSRSAWGMLAGHRCPPWDTVGSVKQNGTPERNRRELARLHENWLEYMKTG